MSDEPDQQVTSDDQELAKVLAGVSQQPDDELPQGQIPSVPAPEPVVPPAIGTDLEQTAELASEPGLQAEVEPVSPMQTSVADESLDGIKLEALQELRPLVDKLNVSNEEKFDTYLLLLRSTDDKELIGPAHEAAKAIEDETRRAQALLDIIKEIDFLSQNKTV